MSVSFFFKFRSFFLGSEDSLLVALAAAVDVDDDNACAGLTSGEKDQWTIRLHAMKVGKSCKEGTAENRRRSGAEGHMFKIRCQQGLFAVIDVIDVIDVT